MILLELLGAPIPLCRPRACKRGGFIHMYDCQKTEKERIQWQVRSLYKEKPMLLPLEIDFVFAMPIPKATSKINHRYMIQGDIHPMKKPDLDNLIKFILDCLNGILFHDDSQVQIIHARKVYSDSPRTIIRATCIEEKNKKIHDANIEVSNESYSQ